DPNGANESHGGRGRWGPQPGYRRLRLRSEVEPLRREEPLRSQVRQPVRRQKPLFGEEPVCCQEPLLGEEPLRRQESVCRQEPVRGEESLCSEESLRREEVGAAGTREIGGPEAEFLRLVNPEGDLMNRFIARPPIMCLVIV